MCSVLWSALPAVAGDTCSAIVWGFQDADVHHAALRLLTFACFMLMFKFLGYLSLLEPVSKLKRTLQSIAV